MTDLTKIKIWKVMASSNYFWITTLIFYFTQRGLKLEEALMLMSIYSFANVLLEFPTGVVGDHFSHKLSCLLGISLAPVFFILVSFPGNVAYYACVNLLASLSISLVSGSDSALLHNISNDYKKDVAQLAPYGILSAVITAAIGSIAASIDMRFPFYLSAGYALISLMFLVSTKPIKQKENTSANIFTTGLEGLKDVFRSQKLIHLFVLSSIWGAFFLSIKWFYNPLFTSLDLPVGIWGIISSCALLSMILGVQLYRKYNQVTFLGIALLLSGFVLLLGLEISYLPLVAILVIHILRGFMDTKLDVDINHTITTSRRASILSFNTLTTRLVSAIYIAGGGMIISKTSLQTLFTITSIALLLATLPSAIQLRNTLVITTKKK